MRQGKVRFFALAMGAMLMFGSNYSFDNPQALQKPIMEDVGLSSTQYNLLYSAFSVPNIFLTLAGGFMIDFLGSQKHYNQDPTKKESEWASLSSAPPSYLLRAWLPSEAHTESIGSCCSVAHFSELHVKTLPPPKMRS